MKNVHLRSSIPFVWRHKSRVIRVMLLLTCLCGLPASAPFAEGQTAGIAGTVIDVRTADALAGATVLLQSSPPGIDRGAATDDSGGFSFGSLGEGAYRLTVSFVGYRQVLLDVTLSAGESRNVMVRMTATDVQLADVVVVSASRRPEKALGAPASVSILESEEFESLPTPNYGENLRTVPGVDVAMIGLTGSRVVARGFDSASSFGLYTLTDYRIAQVPSLRLNFFQMIPASALDIERAEVVLGPGSALYGPNVSSGVVHFLTKSPFEYPGTTLSIAGGERSVFTGSLRHAGVVSDRVAYKVAGEYFRGDDWTFSDPAEPDSIVFGTPTASGRIDLEGPVPNVRDNDVENIKLEGSLEYRSSDRLRATLTAGYSRITNIEISTIGASPGVDWDYKFLQGRVAYGNLFVQAYVNTTDSGQSYFLRSGDRIIDRSRLYVGQIQHRLNFRENRYELTYGADLLLTNPRTDETIHGRNEGSDNTTEVGAYGQGQAVVNEYLKFVGAARVDYHSRFDDPVFSPRVGAVLTPAPGHSVRATYNRSYATPTNIDLFVDLLVLPDLAGLPYELRSRGVPESGFNFRRDDAGGAGGLYMQSPFLPPTAGGPDVYIPADATLMWEAAVAILQAQGVDLSGLPAPASGDVGTQLASLNTATGAFDPIQPAQIRDIAAKPFIYNTFEAGYKGVIGDKLALGLDIWHSRIDHLVTLAVATPNVFLDAASLTDYLTAFLGPETGAALAAGIAQIPLGTVTPLEAGELDPSSLILTPIDGDGYTVSGADLSVQFFPSPSWELNGTYSYLSKNLFPGTSDRAFDFASNTPRHKISGGVKYSNDAIGLGAGARFRYVDRFEVISGFYAGVVDSYGVVDLTGSYRLPIETDLSIGLSVQNAFDNRHAEFIGTPELGRLAMLRLTYSMP